jgi:hypothetical protein
MTQGLGRRTGSLPSPPPSPWRGALLPVDVVYCTRLVHLVVEPYRTCTRTRFPTLHLQMQADRSKVDADRINTTIKFPLLSV